MKRRLTQHLLLRGSREFASVEEYNRFVEGVFKAANAPRQARLAEELALMRPPPAGRLAEYREYAPVVISHCLIRVKGHTYVSSGANITDGAGLKITASPVPGGDCDRSSTLRLQPNRSPLVLEQKKEEDDLDEVVEEDDDFQTGENE